MCGECLPNVCAARFMPYFASWFLRLPFWNSEERMPPPQKKKCGIFVRGCPRFLQRGLVVHVNSPASHLHGLLLPGDSWSLRWRQRPGLAALCAGEPSTGGGSGGVLRLLRIRGVRGSMWLKASAVFFFTGFSTLLGSLGFGYRGPWLWPGNLKASGFRTLGLGVDLGLWAFGLSNAPSHPGFLFIARQRAANEESASLHLARTSHPSQRAACAARGPQDCRNRSGLPSPFVDDGNLLSPSAVVRKMIGWVLRECVTSAS